MPWNEPGKENQEPWDRNKKRNDGPPEIDELIKNLWNKLMGGRGGGSKRSTSGSGGIGVWPVLAVILVIWSAMGFYKVEERQRAVVLRFGAYDRIVGPGLHWIPRGIDRNFIVDVDTIRNYQIQAEMLTKGENIVLVDMGVQYRVYDPELYLFSLTDPDETVRSTAETALRQVIGDSSLNDILAEGKAVIRQRVLGVIRGILSNYKAGVRITDITVGDARPPSQVKPAFDDAIKAREDKERYKNEAEAFANKVVPKADGQAEQILAEAQAYSQQIVADASGKVAIFNKLLPQYNEAPKVTRRRLYLETMEKVLAKTDKVIVDKNSRQVNLLSLDAILAQSRQRSSTKGGK